MTFISCEFIKENSENREENLDKKQKDN